MRSKITTRAMAVLLAVVMSFSLIIPETFATSNDDNIDDNSETIVEIDNDEDSQITGGGTSSDYDSLVLAEQEALNNTFTRLDPAEETINNQLIDAIGDDIDIQTLATVGETVYVSSGETLGTMYHYGGASSGAHGYHTESSFYAGGELAFCVEYYQTFNSGNATTYDAYDYYLNYTGSADLATQIVASCAIGLKYMEDNKSTYLSYFNNDSNLYLLAENIYVWREIERFGGASYGGYWEITPYVEGAEEWAQDYIYEHANDYAYDHYSEYDWGGYVYVMNAGTQNVASFWATERNGYLKVNKTASNLTNLNTLRSYGYDMTGAQYTVYTNSACTSVAQDVNGNNAVLTISWTGSAYESNTVKLRAGTYYVKETQVPNSDFGIDSNVHTVTVSASNTSSNPVVVSSSDFVFGSYLQVNKSSSSTNGESYSMAGAQYTVYTDAACTNTATGWSDSSASGDNPVIMTIGSDNTSNRVALWKGTYYIKETKAPDNDMYELSDEIYGPYTITSDYNVTVTANTSDKLIEQPFTLKKKCVDDLADIVKDNNCYSLEGARYGVYTSNACTLGTELYTLISDKYGNTDSVSLSIGTYYVKELSKDNDGIHSYANGYEIDTKTYTFSVSASGITGDIEGRDSDGSYYFTSTEPPGNDPINLTVQKDAINIAAEDAPSLAGAQFTLTFYGGQYTESEIDSGKPASDGVVKRTWVIGTKPYTLSNGTTIYEAALDSDHIVESKSDALYYYNGFVVCPYGTLVIEETQSPDGYSNEGAWSSQTINGVTTTTGLPQTRIIYNVEDLGDLEELTINYVRTDPIDIWGGLTVPKIDVERDTNVPQGDATLEGAEYTIYYNGDEAITYTDKKTGQEVTITPDEPVMTIITDADGYATTAGSPTVTQSAPVLGDRTLTTDNTLIYGRYYVKETKASTGYLLNEDFRYDFFVGAEVDDSGNVVRDSNGAVEFVENAITVVPNNMLPTLKAENPYDSYEQVIRGGFEIVKRDFESGRDVAEGGASLANAELTLINESDHSVLVGADSLEEFLSNPEKYIYEPGAVIMVLKTDENGWAGVDEDTLPYGSYKIVETLAPEGYLPHQQYKDNTKDDSETVGVLTREFVIRNDGEIVDLTDYTYDFNINDYVYCAEGGDAIYNQVIRADFAIRKITDDQHTMRGVIFKIESNTTHEYHYFMTDENGAYSSACDYAEHDHNTNYHDDPDTWDETSEEELENHCGMWFYGYDDPDSTMIDDTLGALPYDTYTITEIRTEANKDYTLWEDTFTVGPNDNNLVIDMNDIEDKECILSTYSEFTATGSKYSPVSEDTLVSDEVVYENLTRGNEYTLVAKLYDLNTQQFVLTEDGSDILGCTTFTTRTSSGTVRTEFSFDSRDYGGDDLVVFEYLYQGAYDESEIADADPYIWEADPTVADQTLHLPDVHTTALDEETGNHMSYADEEVTIIDTVEYTNLIPGRTYTLTGTLMDKHTGEALLDANGNEITATTTFTPEESEGEVEVEFVFDATGIEGTTVVVFEHVYYNNIEFAAHTDLEDEGQTVYIPKIHTMAWSADTGTNVAVAKDDDTITLYDTVWYSGVQPGTDYHIFGVLLDAETREAEVDKDGNEIYSDYGPFTAYSDEGEEQVEYEIDASQLEGRKTVFFEVLYHVDYDEDGNAIYTLVAEEDIAEAEQESIYFPDLHTTAWGRDTEAGVIGTSDETVLVDTVHYTHLAPGHEYTVTGTLMNKETGEAILDAEGNEITAEASFTPEESEGDAEVEFVFDTTGMEGTTIVVFEDLYYEDIQLAVHADIEDEDQSVYIPKIHTTALDSATDDHISMADDSITIVDTVEYTNLKPGLEYTMTGTLMDKETGEPMRDDNGDEITANTVFVPDEADGTVDVTFTFEGVSLAGKTLVAFESLEYQDIEVAVHTDIEDEDQTVYVPEIHTTAWAESTGTHEVTAEGTVTIIDDVEYSNLIPGKEYTMNGELMDEATGESLGITSETTFTPDEPNGSVQMEFTFDASSMSDKVIVVFEECSIITTEGPVEVGEHKDLTDTDQQVKMGAPQTTETTENPKQETTTTTTPNQTTTSTTTTTPAKTGEIIGFSALAAAIVAAGVVLVVTVVKKRKTDAEG